MIAEVTTLLKKGGTTNNSVDGKKMVKYKGNERYDQNGRSSVRKTKHRRLRTIGKVDVPITNSTYRDYNNYLNAKEQRSLNKQTIKKKKLINAQMKKLENI